MCTLNECQSSFNFFNWFGLSVLQAPHQGNPTITDVHIHTHTQIYIYTHIYIKTHTHTELQRTPHF